MVRELASRGTSVNAVISGPLTAGFIVDDEHTAALIQELDTVDVWLQLAAALGTGQQLDFTINQEGHAST